MLSIYYWMANWVASGLKPSNECVSHYSRTLIEAITREFCDKMTVKEYLDKCHFFLLKKSSILPQCYIRLDVARIMHIISCWTCLKGRHQIKDFYLRCIVRLIKSKSITEFKEILENIIIITVAEYDCDDMASQPTSTEKARHFLCNLIAGTNTPVKLNEDEEQTNYKGIIKKDEFYCELETSSENKGHVLSINSWINDNQQVACKKAIVQGNRLNPYYCIDLKKHLFAFVTNFRYGQQ